MNKKYSYISNIRYEDGQKGNCHRIECITRLSSPYPSLWTDLSREITLPPSDPSSKGWRERKTWKTSGIERRKRRHSYYGNWWMDRLWSIFVESRVESRRFFITCRRGGIVFRVESLNAVGKRHRGNLPSVESFIAAWFSILLLHELHSPGIFLRSCRCLCDYFRCNFFLCARERVCGCLLKYFYSRVKRNWNSSL